MDWKIMLVTFGSVFLAELGDKTQLTTLALTTGKPGAVWMVFLGSALALTTTSAIAAFGGEALASIVPERYLHLASALLFIVMGIVLLCRLDWHSFTA